MQQRRRRAGDLHIRVPADLDPCELEHVFDGLARHYGLDVDLMRKASRSRAGEGPPDPRYPELTTLIRSARKSWELYGQQLLEAVAKLLEEGRLLPMTATNEALLLELFRDHQVAVVSRFAGRATDLPRLERLIRAGLVSPDVQQRSLIDVAFRLGRALPMLEAHRVRAEGAPSLEDIIREAVTVPLTARDRRALEYVKRRGEIYMRRPASEAADEAQRVLTEDEFRVLRDATARGVEQRQGFRDLARELKTSVQGNPTLFNDMDRVARTELAFAHSFGAYEGLKQQAADAGEDDPQVYKFVAPSACADCRRIWGPPRDPKRYALSYIEKREAEGGNFRLPRAQWGPTIGPVHPNCTEGPLQYWTEGIVDSINRAADELIRVFGRR